MFLNFYTIDQNYINHLKTIDQKVPNTNYSTNEKFFCGVVFKINGFDYFAPISSFTTRQQTNVLIYSNSNNGSPIASIRLCYMIPVRQEHLSIKKIEEISNRHYRSLVSAELQFCRANEESIKKAAQRIYNYGTDPNHSQYNNCCKFETLEKALMEYPKN